MVKKGLQEIAPGVWGISSKHTNGEQEGAKKEAQDGVLHDRPVRVGVKPMSVNRAFKGRRFRSKEYDLYEKMVVSMLPKLRIPEPPYHVYYRFFFSNTNADIDNPAKLCTDILQKFYNFNDKNVYRLTIEKHIVKKGQEYFEFMILPFME